VVTGNVKCLPSGWQKGYLWFGLFSFILSHFNFYTLIFTINLLVSGTVTNDINKTHVFIIVTLSPSTSSHERQLRSPQTQPVHASWPLLSSSITAVWLMYAERGMECTVPRETERQYGCNPNWKHATSLRVINTDINLIPVTLQSTPSQCTSILHAKEIFFLEVLNFTLFFPRIFACLSAEHIFDLASNQDQR